MCGILGSVNLTITEAELSQMSHRGPDDHGLEVDVLGDHRITLGHRRLAIVDLSEAGHQPMCTADGLAKIAFNGEIYNHSDLRFELKQKAFCGHSDTESILYQLAEKGVSAASKFNGIFSIAYFNRLDRCLYLIRDPYGVKPMYYSANSGQLVFSSELAPLKKLVGTELNLKALSMLLRLRYIPAPYTMYKNINKVRPGHFIKVDMSGAALQVSEHCYVDYTLQEKTDLSYKDAVEEYRFQFQRAVERQLMADVEIGVLLSGGIDSALVAQYAQQHQKRPLKAFTVGFDGQHLEDEIDDARRSAEIIGMEFHYKRVGVDDFLESLEKIVNIVEEPIATTSIVPMYFLSELASSQVKVVLSGQGADEPLGGYGRYKAPLLFDHLPALFVKPVGACLAGLGIKNETLLRGANAATKTDEIQRMLAVYETFSEDEIWSLTGNGDQLSENLLRHNFKLLQCWSVPTPVERMMRLDLRMNLSDDLLQYTDKITMRHSLECRVPILDHDLVRFIESLPASYRVSLKHQKRIHKDCAKSVLPEEIVNRTKKGFKSPTTQWFRDNSKIRDIFHDSKNVLDGVINLDAVDKVLLQHNQGYNKEKQLFLLLSILFVLKNG